MTEYYLDFYYPKIVLYNNLICINFNKYRTRQMIRGENFCGYRTKPPFAEKASRFTRSPIRAPLTQKHMTGKHSQMAKKP